VLGLVGGVILSAGTAVYAVTTGALKLARIAAGILVVSSAAYMAVLLTVSLRSEEVVLPRGETKHFCGFFLDCHMGVGVAGVAQARSVGTGPDRRSATGVYYFVTLNVASNARRETLSLYRPDVHVVTDDARRFGRDQKAEGYLGGDTSLTRPVAAGSSYPVTLVFDLPADARNPRLLVTQGDERLLDRLPELLMVGDEKSLLHKKTTLAL